MPRFLRASANAWNTGEITKGDGLRGIYPGSARADPVAAMRFRNA